MPSSAQAGFKLILLPISPTNRVGVGLSWAELGKISLVPKGNLAQHCFSNHVLKTWMQNFAKEKVDLQEHDC